MEKACLIIPVGVRKEKIKRILETSEASQVECIVTVTITGYESSKTPLIEAARYLAELIGARHEHIVIRPGSAEDPVRLFRLLRTVAPERVVLAGMSGSRYLYPILLQVLLMYWRVSGAMILIQHGVEWGEYRLEPLQGFASPAMKLTRTQIDLLRRIYESSVELSGKLLIEKYGYTKSVYAVLADMERKGLLMVRRGRILKTLPGRLLYAMLRGEE